MKKIWIVILFLFTKTTVNAQYSFEHYNANEELVKVIENGRELKQAFTGGLKLPQFSACDLNFDGKQDLVVFDKDKSRISTFLNLGGPNEIKYKYAPEYIKNFPVLNSWMLMVDYNSDGKSDIFTSQPSGIRVFENIGDSINGLKFQKKQELVMVNYGNIISNLSVQPSDIPAIIDLDSDGDIDILHFISPIDSSGESVYWYKNIGMETFNSPDSLSFIVAKRCWGRFRESANTCNININYSTGICAIGGSDEPIPNSTYSNMHEGATTSIMDVTGDGIVDIMIGDPSCSNVNMLVNGATNTEAIMINKVENFPSQRPISLQYFPAVFHVDVNNDGLKDLISTPNSFGSTDNINHVLLYLNNGSIGLNRYDFNTDKFLLNEMIDVGDGSSPAFVDYNLDGLMDMVIANYNYSSNGIATTGLALYKNIGSLNIPKYELITRDWGNFSSLNISSMAPCFGDLDQDGDLDMVCGATDGTIHFFRNIASIGSTMNLQFIPDYFLNIDVGNHSSPSLYDFNGDGKLELIIGRKFDNFRLYENTGSITSPNYTLASDSLYKINLKNYLIYPSGRGQMSIVQLRPNEQPRVVITNGNGKFYILDEVNSNYNTNMNKAVDSINFCSGSFSDFSGGFNFSMADLNGDAKPELVVGTPQGGLFLYRNTSLNVGINKEYDANNISLYPNPSKDLIFIKTNTNETILSVKLIDLSGRVIANEETNSRNIQLIVSEQTPGIYFIQVESENGIYIKKVIIQR